MDRDLPVTPDTRSEAAGDDVATSLAVEQQEKSLRQQAMKDPAVKALVGSRLASVLGIATLTYGAMVYLAAIGAPQILISLTGATRYLAALLFGIGGGALADAMSKRTAMVTAYTLQAAACFIIPTVWGTSVASLMVLIFVTALLGQIITPAVKAATALVTPRPRSPSSRRSSRVASGIGSALGTTVLAPILINFGTLQMLAYVVGIVLAFGAIRALKVPQEEESTALRQAVRTIDWRGTIPTLQRHGPVVAGQPQSRSDDPRRLDRRRPLRWAEHPDAGLHARRAGRLTRPMTVYILAPGGIGFLAGDRARSVADGPPRGTRVGRDGADAPQPRLRPLRADRPGGADPGARSARCGCWGSSESSSARRSQAAGLISILTALGSTGAGAAVQTYVNRYIMLARQATTFGMQEVLDNALTLFAVLALGALATLLGPRLVFVVAPPLIVAVVVWLIRVCFRVTDQDPPEARRILRALLGTDREESPSAGTPH